MARGVWSGKRRKLPTKGTVLRKMCNLALRPCGVDCYHNPNIRLLSVRIRELWINYGLDFRVIATLPNKKNMGRGRHINVYRLVGRQRDDGTYLDYLARDIKNPVKEET